MLVLVELPEFFTEPPAPPCPPVPPIAVETALPPLAVEDELELLFDLDWEDELLFELELFVFVMMLPAGGVVPGGTTSHSYNWPATPSFAVPRNNWPSPSPYVPAVPVGTGTRSARELLQFHAFAAGLQSIANATTPTAITAFILSSMVFAGKPTSNSSPFQGPWALSG